MMYVCIDKIVDGALSNAEIVVEERYRDTARKVIEASLRKIIEFIVNRLVESVLSTPLIYDEIVRELNEASAILATIVAMKNGIRVKIHGIENAAPYEIEVLGVKVGSEIFATLRSSAGSFVVVISPISNIIDESIYKVMRVSLQRALINDISRILSNLENEVKELEKIYNKWREKVDNKIVYCGDCRYFVGKKGFPYKGEGRCGINPRIRVSADKQSNFCGYFEPIEV